MTIGMKKKKKTRCVYLPSRSTTGNIITRHSICPARDKGISYVSQSPRCNRKQGHIQHHHRLSVRRRRFRKWIETAYLPYRYVSTVRLANRLVDSGEGLVPGACVLRLAFPFQQSQPVTTLTCVLLWSLRINAWLGEVDRGRITCGFSPSTSQQSLAENKTWGGPLPTGTAVGHRVSTNHGGCSITVLDSRAFSSQVASWQHTLAGGRQCLTAPASPAPAVSALLSVAHSAT